MNEDGHMFDLASVARRMTITPAERAVLAEQVEALLLDYKDVLESAKTGTTEDLVVKFAKTAKAAEYISFILGRKISAIVEDDHTHGRDH